MITIRIMQVGREVVYSRMESGDVGPDEDVAARVAGDRLDEIGCCEVEPEECECEEMGEAANA